MNSATLTRPGVVRRSLRDRVEELQVIAGLLEILMWLECNDQFRNNLCHYHFVIPRHRPPFSLREFLVVQMGSSPEPIDKLEKKIAGLLDMPEAILLPSARFGIWAALKIVAPTGQAVGVPALNCSAVYEAVIRSCLRAVFADCRENSFLMDLDAVPGTYAWILSELYGHTYELKSETPRPPVCIFDMAMTIPEKRLLNRLRPSDLGLFSFGLGKSGYAGWGGVALTHDKSLARELHHMVRDSCVGDLPQWFNVQRTLTMGARVIAHWSPFYGLARKIQDLRHPPRKVLTFPNDWSRQGTEGEEWRRLPVQPEIKMLSHNLQSFARNAGARRELETQFRYFFQGIDGVTLPAVSIGVLSHFTIRVPARTKEPIRQSLWKHGIDVGDVIGLPSYCDLTVFPNASKASLELLNLPLDPGITTENIRSMATILRNALRTT